MSKNIIPQLSDDIVIHTINKNEFFIHQTVYDHRVKISSELYDFLKLIDNSKDLATIVNEYNSKYESILTEGFAKDFLYNKLAKYGIIIDETTTIKSNTKPSYLKLSFIFISKKRVSKITKYLKYLFIPKVIFCMFFLSFIIIIFSFYILRDQIFHSTITKPEWMIFFTLSFIGVTFHEFGHASAASYYGAEHGGIGGGFYLFMPVYFADVTDIWKLTKQKRIIVNLAGIYFELIYVFILILFGYIFDYTILIMLSCIFSLSILHSLNPFLRSDGYWVLSDAIEKPNLMSHGFIKITQIFRRKNSWLFLDYFILIYGLISYSFILFFLYFVIVKNPNSILYFPQNLKHFFENIFYDNGSFSLVELGKLFIPLLFFYLVFGILKNLYKSLVLKV